MSMTLMAKAMKIKVGNHLRKLVLIKMADNANDKGECWPSYRDIADHCECSKSGARAHVDALINMGLITKENRLGENNGKGNTSNLYYLTLDNPVSSKSTAPCATKKHSPVSSKSIGVCQQVAPPMPPDGTPPMPPDGTRISHSFEPVIEPKEKPPLTPPPVDNPEAGQNQTAGEVFYFLNSLLGVKTQPDQQALRFILDRLADGYSRAELELVAEHRTEQLRKNPKLAHMLSPNLLFAAQTFGAYLVAANAWQKKRTQQADRVAAVEQQRQSPPVGDVPGIDFEGSFERLFVEGLPPESLAEKLAWENVQKNGFKSPGDEVASRKEWRVILNRACVKAGRLEA